MIAKYNVLRLIFILCICFSFARVVASPLKDQNEKLFSTLKKVHNLTESQMKEIRRIFEKSGYISQGNPKITDHPFTRKQCLEKLNKLAVDYQDNKFESVCGAKYMAPLYNPAIQKQDQAKACIDQFEFPNIPCTYPVIWVRAKEAHEICQVMGKRMCDAHEWEGACEGALREPDYRFDLAKGYKNSEAFNRMRRAHNQKHRKKVWGYGSEYKKGICAASSYKSSKCTGGNWRHCGSNTYPTGFFPECTSSLKVYDIHGNAAEHMNLPLNEGQMASRGSQKLGLTEMKGSWFIWDKYYAHQDHCRWRAPYWHGTRVMSDHSHHNYHLGFRCCKTIKE